MKNQTAPLFAELMKSYYGVSSTPELSNTAKVEALLTDYYGRAYKRKRQTPAPAVSLSLSHDNGEVLPQPASDDPFEEYVVQKCAAAQSFEEYTLRNGNRFAARAFASSLNVGGGEPVSAHQECQVDVLDPLQTPAAPSRGLLLPAPNNSTYPPADSRQAQQQSTSCYSPAADDSSRAKASDDDFISDMKSILSGQAVFDPASGRTISKDNYARQPPVEPARANERAFPEADKSQAIFDRIAQSMQYANLYDLGTVELENRFADFDRVSDLQQQARETKKSKPAKAANYSAAAPAKVDSADFIQDLEAIRNSRTTTEAPATPSSSTTGASLQSSVGNIIVPAPRVAVNAQRMAASLSEPVQEVCGFFGPNNVALTESDLRAGIASVTVSERSDWFDAAGNARSESDDVQFGQLVFYNLARQSDILPTTLTAMQAMAISGGVNYGHLLTAAATGAQINNAVTTVRTALLAGAPNTNTPANLNNLVEQALRNARGSRFDTFAWSAVFVSSCVRRTAIQLGLEAEVSGTHVGKNELLVPHEAHRVYVVEAFNRRKNSTGGGYQAFRINERTPQVGDIIIQDRQANNLANVVTFDQIPTVLPGGRDLHGDIIVEVAADNVTTIGGNLSGGVRRRRYPLDATGHLVVQREQLFTQESANGNLANVPVQNNAAGLDLLSTGRVFTLLSLVQVCAAVPGQTYHGGVLT